MRDGSLAELSVLDSDLTKRVVQAFELNAWVAEALWAGKRPEKTSPRVIVKLRYREPVIMVRTVRSALERGLFLASGHGGRALAARGVLGNPDQSVLTRRSRQFAARRGCGHVLRRCRCDRGRTDRHRAQDCVELDGIGVDCGSPRVAAGCRTARGANISSAALWSTRRRGRRALGVATCQPLQSAVRCPEPGSAVGPRTWPRSARRSIGCGKGRASATVRQSNGRLDQLPPTTIIDLRPAAGTSVVDEKTSLQPLK